MAVFEERQLSQDASGDGDGEIERHADSRHRAKPELEPVWDSPGHTPQPDTAFDILAQRPEAPKPPEPPTADPLGREGLLVASAWSDQWQAELEKLRELQRWPDAPEPTIQVTIGRVEVRAEAPSVPPKPKPKAKTPAVMSLDDYLNQRKGRGSL
jgi:hypothetical protein